MDEMVKEMVIMFCAGAVAGFGLACLVLPQIL